MSLQIRTDVVRVARDIVPMWPLSSFIAVNPLAAYEDVPFEKANVPGIALTRPLEGYLSDVHSGRITHQDLVAAVVERAPALLTLADVTMGARAMNAADIAVAELIMPAPSAIAPSAHSVAGGIVDDLTVKWVAAFLDSHPLWPMPHREDGLYAAWRALATHDPDLPRSARRAVRALPVKADDALSSALVRLNIEAADRQSVLRAELASLPGWASHIKWRAEHVGDVNLVEYLAIRMSLRAVLGRQPTITSPPTAADVSSAEPAQRAAELARQLQAGRDPITLETLAQILSLHPSATHPFTLQRAYELHYQKHPLEPAFFARFGPVAAGTVGRLHRHPL